MALTIAASISASMSARICASVLMGAPSIAAPTGQGRWQASITERRAGDKAVVNEIRHCKASVVHSGLTARLSRVVDN